MASPNKRDDFMDEKELMGIHLKEENAKEHVLKGKNMDDGYFYYYDEMVVHE